MNFRVGTSFCGAAEPMAAEKRSYPRGPSPEFALLLHGPREGNRVHQDPESCNPPLSDAAGTSRRQLLAWLAAAPVALGLAVIAAEHDAVDAKKKKKRKRKKRKKGNGGGYSADAEEQAFLGLINAHRGANGVGPLSLQGQLGAASKQHSQAMASQNSMYHNADLVKYLSRFGYNGSLFAENIAAGYGTAQQVFTAWKNSPVHNLNMLNGAFTEIGIGRAYNPGASYGWFWTTEFGRR